MLPNNCKGSCEPNTYFDVVGQGKVPVPGCCISNQCYRLDHLEKLLREQGPRAMVPLTREPLTLRTLAACHAQPQLANGDWHEAYAMLQAEELAEEERLMAAHRAVLPPSPAAESHWESASEAASETDPQSEMSSGDELSSEWFRPWGSELRTMTVADLIASSDCVCFWNFGDCALFDEWGRRKFLRYHENPRLPPLSSSMPACCMAKAEQLFRGLFRGLLTSIEMWTDFRRRDRVNYRPVFHFRDMTGRRGISLEGNHMGELGAAHAFLQGAYRQNIPPERLYGTLLRIVREFHLSVLELDLEGGCHGVGHEPYHVNVTRRLSMVNFHRSRDLCKFRGNMSSRLRLCHILPRGSS
jgi:hypothetical protein